MEAVALRQELKPMSADKIAVTVARTSRGPQSHPGSQKEQTARSAVEVQVGCKLTDLEWDHARATLLEFAMILRDWHHDLITRQLRVTNAA